MSDLINSNPRVAICVPSQDLVHADFAMCLAGLVADRRSESILINSKTSNVAVGRNNLVNAAEELGANWILFLDSDMLFPQDVLVRLLGHRRDIVGATYPRRVPNHETLGAMVGQIMRATVDSRVTPLVEMERMPAGCLLINMRVFKKLSKPFFHFGVDAEKGEVISEDFQFCADARDAGFKIWCDTKLSEGLGHIGTNVYRVRTEARTAGGEDFTVDARTILAAATDGERDEAGIKKVAGEAA